MTNRLTKLAIGLSAAALAIGGVACAQTPQSSPPQDPFRMDANGGGTITRAEAQAAAEAQFTRLDVNKDGKLDQADRDARRAQMREEQFKRLDTNNDGVISKAEFMADRGPEGWGDRGPRGGPGKRGPHDRGSEGRPDMPPPPGAPRQDGAPDAPGAPGQDGGPGKGDRRMGDRGHFGRGFGGDRGDMMAMADTNKDGSISKAEFVAAAMKRFDAMDTNHDGQVTKAERQAAHPKMRGGRRGPPEGAPPPPPAATPAQ
ncbi:EF-hand domain-containing protein [Novosphingobium sp. BL-8A]|uniref:EF-hand domain-containing protein n=1 Tax=Novosphingobium sp. BL-8A TaxID=3127639 RepID=UPI003757FB17